MEGIADMIGICAAGGTFLSITIGTIRRQRNDARTIARKMRVYGRGCLNPQAMHRFNRRVLRRLWHYTQV